jgi:hypothetical protein
MHSAALFASIASLGLICAIYYCNILSRRDSLLRSDTLAMILLALLTGMFPLALTASLVGLWMTLSAGFSVAAFLSAGVDLASFGAVAATIIVGRILVKATYRTENEPDNVTPLTPRPVSTGPARRTRRMAA